MAEFKRLLLWGISLTALVTVVLLTGIFLVYQSSYREHREVLRDLVDSQAALISAVARFDAFHSEDYAGVGPGGETGAPGATLNQIREAFAKDPGHGRTGELVLGKRDGNDIVILLHQRERMAQGSHRLPADSERVSALRRALAGESIVFETTDLSGTRVLAATHPLPGLEWALVAKRDLAEIRAPFMQAAGIAGTVGLLIIFVAGSAFRRAMLPAVDRLRRSESRYHKVIANASEGVLAVDEYDRVTLVNQRTREILGLGEKNLEGLPLVDVLPGGLAEIGRADLEALHRGREEFFEHEVMVQGVAKYLDVSAVALRSPRGEYEGAMALISDVTERRRNREALEHDRKLLRSVLNNLPVGVWAVDRNARFSLHNPAGDRMLGLEGGDYAGGRALFLEFKGWNADSGEPVSADDWGLLRALDKGESTHNQVVNVRGFDGVDRLLRYGAAPLWGEGGDRLGAIAVAEDMTARRQAELEMRKLSDAVRHTADAVVIMSPEGCIEFVNEAFERITGYSRDEAVGRRPMDLLQTDVEEDHYQSRVWERMRAGQAFREVTVNRRKDGSLFNWDATLTPILDQRGNVTSIVATATDLSAQDEVRLELYRATRFDALTGLSNRGRLMDQLEQSLAGSGYRPRVTGLVLLDLDRFTAINESFGQGVGNQVLKETASRLGQVVREGDVVARVGADSFAIVFNDLAEEEDVSDVIGKLRQALAPAHTMDGKTLYVTVSVGVALAPRDGVRADTLYSHAESALAQARQTSGDNLSFYAANVGETFKRRMEMEAALREAVDKGEFELHFQPQINLADGSLRGMEALLRWQHPEWGAVSPAEFIPLAEHSGLIVPISRWVLTEAMRSNARWQAMGLSPGVISVNLSAREFASPGLIKDIHGALSASGLHADKLELEITETVLMGEGDPRHETLRKIKEQGISVAIDDFGTGYSSLAYVSGLPLDALKIDRCFISELGTDTCRDASIVRSIISMAHALGLVVIAEGVETEWQQEFLQGLGCDVMQGFLAARPMPADAVLEYLRQQPATVLANALAAPR